jgi:hypothetical protein
MGISVPVEIAASDGVANAGLPDGTPLVTIADCPQGATIVVALYCFVTANTTANGTLVDSVGNIYLPLVNTPATASVFGASLYYCPNCKHIPLGGTITATIGQAFAIVAAYVTGAAGFDKIVPGVAAGQVNTITVSTGPLAYGNEIVFGALSPQHNTAGVVPRSDVFTTLESIGAAIDFAYYLPGNSVASASYIPTWTATGTAAALVASFASGDFGGVAGLVDTEW